jgi:hypothetical protein
MAALLDVRLAISLQTAHHRTSVPCGRPATSETSPPFGRRRVLRRHRSTRMPGWLKYVSTV